MLADISEIAEVHLEANNRTWDTVAERGDELGVFTDARPPYGCLGPEAARRNWKHGASVDTRARHVARPAGRGRRPSHVHIVRGERHAAGRCRPPPPTPTAGPKRRSSSGDRLEPGSTSSRFTSATTSAAPARRSTDPPFLDDVVVRVGIADAAGHVPRAAAALAYGYSTYRGSCAVQPTLPAGVRAQVDRAAAAIAVPACTPRSPASRRARFSRRRCVRCMRDLSAWMTRAGMSVRVDAAGNLRGVYSGVVSAMRRGCSSARTSTRCRGPAPSTASSAWSSASRSSNARRAAAALLD